MFDAHMDEVGIIVTGIEKGFLRFSTLGGIDPRMFPASEVKLLTEPPMFGVIGTLPPHILSGEDMDKTIDTEKLFIDVGLNENEAKLRVPPGTPAVFAGKADKIGDGVICGKSLDNRVCAAIIIKLMEILSSKKLNADIYCLFSVQEELGARGAITGAFGINPDYAVVIDATFATTPDSGKAQTLKMGKGAAIGVGPNMNRNITDELIATAERNAIPYQLEVLSGNSGTDAWVIQICRDGIPTGLVSLPVKYMHSPVEIMNLQDAGAVVSLLTEFALKTGDGLCRTGGLSNA
jgi:endoglucanase